MWNKDEVEGKADQLKGKAKEKFAAIEKAGVRTVRSLEDLGEEMATALK